MNEITTWAELFLSSITSFASKTAEVIPYLIGAVIIFLIGWLLAKLISFLIFRLLKASKFDAFADRIKASEFLEKANIKTTPSRFIGKCFFWFIMLLVLISASETLGWEAVSSEISKLLSYLPKLFVALVIFIVGAFLATFLRDLLKGATSNLGISTSRFVSSFVFYLFMIMVTLTALEQAGIDTNIITSNLLLILGSILAAAAISYGFASRDILSNILAGYFGRNTYVKGMKIEINGAIGIVEETSSIGITLKCDNGDMIIIPTKEIITNQVRIFK